MSKVNGVFLNKWELEYDSGDVDLFNRLKAKWIEKGDLNFEFDYDPDVEFSIKSLGIPEMRSLTLKVFPDGSFYAEYPRERTDRSIELTAESVRYEFANEIERIYDSLEEKPPDNYNDNIKIKAIED